MTEFAGRDATMTPEGVYIIGTYDENGVANAMNAAWGVQSGFDEISLFISNHKTTQNLLKTKAFTVAFATEDTVEISDYFGIATGAKEDKIAKAGVHVHKSTHVNAPIIEEYPLTMECELVSYDPATMQLVGRVVAEQADESILTDGVVDQSKLKPIIYDPALRAYRTVGPVIAKAWDAGKGIK